MIQTRTDTENKYRFLLKADNGATILKSVAFSDKYQMDQAIQKLSTLSPTRNHFERKTNTDGRFLFLMKDDQGGTLGHSELYDSEAGMENGIKNLREDIKSFL